MKLLKSSAFIILFLLLTIFSQVGGIILFLCTPVFRKIRKKHPDRIPFSLFNTFAFFGIFLFFSFVFIPVIAPLFGRVPLPVFGNPDLKPLNLMTCLLNRHYVKPELKKTLEKVAVDIEKQFPGTVISYLDANFPFINNFPLFPHLSHDDGKKLDIAFLYKDTVTKEPLNRKAASFIGYGVYEGPKKGEEDYPSICAKKGYWQYSFLGRIIPQGGKDQLLLDEKRTRALALLLANHPSIGKIFLEPHLKTRLKLNDQKIRYHGCQAVRHDDHLHLQL